MTHPSKVTPSHLQRAAYVYVRQSTFQQVLKNKESRARQYDFRTRAVELGWRPEQVTVIDEDLGESAVTSTQRSGFQRLVADVGLGKVGVILGLEVSRLARNCSDWYRLLEICGPTATLVGDEDGIYDPNGYNDRLLLGLKGTMSEAEIFILRARLEGGKLHKARRGELALQLPAGLVYDREGRVQFDPDSQVHDAVQHVFESFRRVGSALGVVRYFRKSGLRLPLRVASGPAQGDLVWVEPTLARCLHMLRNPRYAGAFAYGRTRRRRGLPAQYRLPPEEWKVCIRNAHPAFITWDNFLANRAQLVENSPKYRREEERLPPREGPALLQGLLICGLCGRRMTLRYHGRRDGLRPDYVCQKIFTERGGQFCQYIPGSCVDQAIGKLVLDAVTPASLDVAIQVFEEMRRREDEVDRLHEAKRQRARYEAEMARRQFMLVNPENRLVAEALEREWNERLQTLQSAEQAYAEWSQKRLNVMSPEVRDKILRLTQNLPTVWSAPRTSPRDKKRMLRLVIEDLTLIRRGREIDLKVRWRGGAVTETSIPVPPNGIEARRTPPNLLNRIAEDAHFYTDREIAERLKGSLSGTGLPLTPALVTRIRREQGIAGLADHLRQAGWLSAQQATETFKITRSALMNWRRKGILEVRQCGDRTWVFKVPRENPPRSQQGVPFASRGLVRTTIKHLDRGGVV